MRRALLVAAFVILVIFDVVGVSWLVAVGGLGLAFAVVGRGGMWVPSVIIGVAVDAALIWLTVAIGRRMRANQ